MTRVLCDRSATDPAPTGRGRILAAIRRAIERIAENSNTRWNGAMLVLPVIFLVAYFAKFFPFYIDDTFIHLRYAARLLDGHGFAYNVGQPPVLGTSSPLWDALLVPIVMFNRMDPLPGVKILALILALGVYLLTIVTFVTITRKSDIPSEAGVGLTASLTIMLLLTSAIHWQWFYSGMEIPLYNFAYLLVALLVALLVNRPSKPILHGAALAGASFLVFLSRPEGAVVALSAFLALVLMLEIQPLKLSKPNVRILSFVLVAGMLGIGWLIYTQVVFGYTLPTTVSAKGAAMPLLSVSPVELLRGYAKSILHVYSLMTGAGLFLVAAILVFDWKIAVKWARSPLVLFNLAYISFTLLIYTLTNGFMLERHVTIFGPALAILVGHLALVFWSILASALPHRTQLTATKRLKQYRLLLATVIVAYVAYICLRLLLIALSIGDQYILILGPAFGILVGHFTMIFWSVLARRQHLTVGFRESFLVAGFIVASIAAVSFWRASDIHTRLVARYDNLKTMSEFLKIYSGAHLEDTWIVAEGIGVLGYYTNASMIDIAGLVSPEFTKNSYLLQGDTDGTNARLRTQRDVLRQNILTRRPQFIMLKPGQFQAYIEGLFSTRELTMMEVFRTPDDLGWGPFVAWEVIYN